MKCSKHLKINKKIIDEVIIFYNLIGFKISNISENHNEVFEVIVDFEYNVYTKELLELEERYLLLISEKVQMKQANKPNKKMFYLTLILLYLGTILINMIKINKILFYIGLLLIVLSFIIFLVLNIKKYKYNNYQEKIKKINKEQLIILNQLRK